MKSNRVLCVKYRNLEFTPDFIFSAARLANAVDPPTVLKPGDLNPRNNREWRPRMGFGHRRDQANLGQAGKDEIHFKTFGDVVITNIGSQLFRTQNARSSHQPFCSGATSDARPVCSAERTISWSKSRVRLSRPFSSRVCY